MERRPRLSPRPFELSRTQKIETIRQSLCTVEVLLQSTAGYQEFTVLQSAFDLGKRHFRLGQWVDVLDTVNQWLEAQIVEVREADQMVYINYNGWASRWDEWLECSSLRIQLFRTHTKQGVYAAMQSPVPMVISASTFAAAESNLEASDLFLTAQSALLDIKALLGRYRLLRYQVERESQMVRLVQPAQASGDLPIETESSASDWSSGDLSFYQEDSAPLQVLSAAQIELVIRSRQLAALSDRMGRVMTDLATLTSSAGDGQLQVMPTQSLLTEESEGTEMFIHIYNFRPGTPARRAR